MGIFDRIRKTLTPTPDPTIDDSRFGRLVFFPPDLWQSGAGHESDVSFEPTHDKVSITVTGDENGPLPSAHDKYEELKLRYAELIPSIASFLREEYCVVNPSKDSVSDTEVVKSFTISAVTIKLTTDDPEPEIILTYHPEWRWELHIDITIKGWQAINAEEYD
jgi:hypothetical protein